MIPPWYISFCGPTAHPTFHPVAFSNLPAEKIEIVLFQLLPMEAKCEWLSPSKVKNSYTSSEKTTTWGQSSSISLIYCISSTVKTLPVGLCGVLKMNTLEVGLDKAARSTSGSNFHVLPSYVKGIPSTLPPANSE